MELKSPTVSILIPVYNVEPYLPKCLETVLDQTYANLQVVLIDDGSKDNSWKLMEEYAAKDKRVEIYHQENQGVSPTRNHLLEKVKGDYVLFVDSDDWIELNMVEYLVGLAVKHKTGFVMCDKVINDAPVLEAEPEVGQLSQEQAIADFLRHEYFVGSLWNKLFDSRLLQGLQFNEDIWYGEDALFCWEVLQRVDTVITSSKQLYHYRDLDSSISHQTFGEKKLTENKSWKIITEAVKLKWPQFTNLALSTWSMADMYLLQAAAKDGYPYNDNIKILQNNIRSHYWLVLPRIKNDYKAVIYLTMIFWSYGFGKLFVRIHRVKNFLKRVL